RPRRGVLARQGLDAVPDAGLLYAPAPEAGRLPRGQYAAGARPGAVGDLWPLADLPRAYVLDQDRGRPHFCAKADELPRPCAAVQERPQILSRFAGEDRRIRRRASLRAFRRAAR